MEQGDKTGQASTKQVSKIIICNNTLRLIGILIAAYIIYIIIYLIYHILVYIYIYVNKLRLLKHTISHFKRLHCSSGDKKTWTSNSGMNNSSVAYSCSPNTETNITGQGQPVIWVKIPRTSWVACHSKNRVSKTYQTTTTHNKKHNMYKTCNAFIYYFKTFFRYIVSSFLIFISSVYKIMYIGRIVLSNSLYMFIIMVVPESRSTCTHCPSTRAANATKRQPA